jgi:hypothetical protein
VLCVLDSCVSRLDGNNVPCIDIDNTADDDTSDVAIDVVDIDWKKSSLVLKHGNDGDAVAVVRYDTCHAIDEGMDEAVEEV